MAGADPFGKEVLEETSDTVKIIAMFSIGYDKIDIETAIKLGMVATNSLGCMSAKSLNWF